MDENIAIPNLIPPLIFVSFPFIYFNERSDGKQKKWRPNPHWLIQFWFRKCIRRGGRNTPFHFQNIKHCCRVCGDMCQLHIAIIDRRELCMHSRDQPMISFIWILFICWVVNNFFYYLKMSRDQRIECYTHIYRENGIACSHRYTYCIPLFESEVMLLTTNADITKKKVHNKSSYLDTFC